MNSSPGQVIVLATPVFLLLIGLELAWGWHRKRNTYGLADAITSIGLGMLSQAGAVFTSLFRIGLYTAIFESLALWRADAFWTAPAGWVLALVFYDFCYYWQHRASHRIAVLWAAHVVHHQSRHYNLSTALRQPGTSVLLGWIFYVPMAVAGVPPLVFAVVALVDLLYQFWVHTEHVPRLGWFDRWFCSPSNHRVHHAVNDRYLDRNYGGILMLWDRLFGSFQEEEDEPCVYGTRAPLDSWDPLWANAEVYWSLAGASWRTRRWADKLRVWFKPPGWRPADVAARFPRPAFALDGAPACRAPISRAVAAFALMQFAALLGGVALFLWHGRALPLSHAVAWLAVLCASLWALGAVLQGRLGRLEVLMLEAGALAMATAVTGYPELHHLFKPLAIALAMAFVLQRRLADARFALLLLGGLACSLAGDVFLMLPDAFLPGLACFLVAHVCYIALLRRGAPWFASRLVLAGALMAAAVMVAFLWPRLTPGLRLGVGAYALAIALMAAQAIGRALVVRDPPAIGVAVGAAFFVVSDFLLAIDRFVATLPLAPLWILGTYYVAQLLIARNARPVEAGQAVPASASRLTAA